MRPLRNKLRKFKGIRSGLGRDEVEFNFEGLQGLVALIGDNGKGKSTLMQNMHPYRLMPDKVKTYSPKACNIFNETYGRDACKDFHFMMDGAVYRSLIMIDAEKRKQEAYLYKRGEGGAWEPYGGTRDGKLDAYDLAVEKLVGSPRMFFTSIFRSQKAPALSSYTRGEMMDIFAELLNIDDLQEKADTASAVSDALGKKRATLVAERTQLEGIVKEEAKKTLEREQAEAKIKVIAQEISSIEVETRKVEEAIKSLEIKLSLRQEALKNKERIETDIATKEKRLTELQTSVTEKKNLYNEKYKVLKTKHLSAQELAKMVPSLRLKATEEEAKISEAVSLREQVRTVDERYVSLGKEISAFAELEARIATLEKTLQKLRLTQAHAVEMVEKDLKNADEKRKSTELQLASICDLVKKAPELREKAKEETLKVSEIDSLKSQLTKADEKHTALGKELFAFNEIEAEIKESEKNLQKLRLNQAHAIEMAEKDLKNAHESSKKLLEVPCAGTELSGVCKFVKDAVRDKNSITLLEEAVKKAKESTIEESVLTRQLEDLRGKVSGKSDVEKELRGIEEQKRILSAKLDAIQKELEALRESLKILSQVKQAEKTLPELEKELVALNASMSKLGETVKQAKEPKHEAVDFLKQIEELRPKVAGKAAVEKEVGEVEGRKKTLAEALEKAEKVLEAIRVDLKSLSQAEEAEKALPELEKELLSILDEGKQVLGEIKKQMGQLTSEIASLSAELSKVLIDGTLQAQIDKYKESVENHKKTISDKRKEESVVKVSVGSLTESLRVIEESKGKLVEVSTSVANIDNEITEWQILEAAMEGIVTLEIDDAGPSVTSITNDILHTCYGPRFSVKIKTQDEKSNGKEMKEVFDIEVFDAERDDKKSLSDMSGGEETWVDDAVTRGICLFNAARSGKKYHMLFSDEKDGRLTEQRRREFMAVKRRVLELGGFDGEYFISHTKEIQEMADSSINLNEMFPERTAKRQANCENEQITFAAA